MRKRPSDQTLSISKTGCSSHWEQIQWTSSQCEWGRSWQVHWIPYMDQTISEQTQNYAGFDRLSCFSQMELASRSMDALEDASPSLGRNQTFQASPTQQRVGDHQLRHSQTLAALSTRSQIPNHRIGWSPVRNESKTATQQARTLPLQTSSISIGSQWNTFDESTSRVVERFESATSKVVSIFLLVCSETLQSATKTLGLGV